MKKHYIKPELKSVKIETTQIICSSLTGFKLYSDPEDDDDYVGLGDAL